MDLDNLLLTFIILFIFGMVAWYFYTHARASLFEYFVILVCATFPYAGLQGRFSYNSGNSQAQVDALFGMSFALVVLYAASKGLNWAQRRNIQKQWPRIALIVLAILTCVSGLWQMVFGMLLVTVKWSNAPLVKDLTAAFVIELFALAVLIVGTFVEYRSPEIANKK